jgi:hypothetical protein
MRIKKKRRVVGFERCMLYLRGRYDGKEIIYPTGKIMERRFEVPRRYCGSAAGEKNPKSLSRELNCDHSLCLVTTLSNERHDGEVS